MNKFLKIMAIACACAIAALAVIGCGSPEVSRSSEPKLEVESKAEPVSTDPVYIMAIGNDSRYKTAEDKGVAEDSPSYSDTMMVLRVDPGLNYIGILSVPRDTAADVSGQPNKINALHEVGGAEAVAAEVGSMLGVEIPYYFDLKFVDFANLIDKLGGVTVDVPMGLTGGDILSGKKITLSAGENTLDGASALMLSRQRKVYDGSGEAIRQLISRTIVANAIQAVADEPSSDAASYAEILESFGETNMPEATLEAYIAAYMDNSEPIVYNLGTMPYRGDIDETGSWRIPRNADVYAELHDALENATPINDVVTPPEVY